MPAHRKHTYESFIAVAAHHATRTALRKNAIRVYEAADRNGWLDAYYGAPPPQPEEWTEARIAEISKLYPTRTAMHNSPHQWALKVARKNEWLHVLPPLKVKKEKQPYIRPNLGATKHPLYRSYRSMIHRCSRTYATSYGRYGGRGITVCDRWLHGEAGKTGFECFVDDMGPKPTPKHSIDRINNDGNYSPDNCRWATVSLQARNKNFALSPVDLCFVLNRVKGLKTMAKELNCNIKTVKTAIRSYALAKTATRD